MRERMNAPLVQIVTLSLWLGAATFFSFAVAPALFATLPSRTMAGAVVGRTLPIVFYLGLAVGGIMIALQASSARGALRDARALCGCVMVAACGVAQLIVGRAHRPVAGGHRRSHRESAGGRRASRRVRTPARHQRRLAGPRDARGRRGARAGVARRAWPPIRMDTKL